MPSILAYRPKLAIDIDDNVFPKLFHSAFCWQKCSLLFSWRVFWAILNSEKQIEKYSCPIYLNSFWMNKFWVSPAVL